MIDSYKLHMTYCFRLEYYWWFDEEPKGQWNQCLWPHAHIRSILIEIHPAEGFRANCLHLLWVNKAFSCPDELNQHDACNNCQICPASFFFMGYQSSVHCSSCSYCPAPAVKGFWLSRGNQFSLCLHRRRIRMQRMETESSQGEHLHPRNALYSPSLSNWWKLHWVWVLVALLEVFFEKETKTSLSTGGATILNFII